MNIKGLRREEIKLTHKPTLTDKKIPVPVAKLKKRVLGVYKYEYSRHCYNSKWTVECYA